MEKTPHERPLDRPLEPRTKVLRLLAAAAELRAEAARLLVELVKSASRRAERRREDDED